MGRGNTMSSKINAISTEVGGGVDTQYNNVSVFR